MGREIFLSLLLLNPPCGDMNSARMYGIAYGSVASYSLLILTLFNWHDCLDDCFSCSFLNISALQTCMQFGFRSGMSTSLPSRISLLDTCTEQLPSLHASLMLSTVKHLI